MGNITSKKQLSRFGILNYQAFPEDISIFMKTYDEAEREAYYKQNFKILFQLNQFILPVLYVFIFVISLSLREIQYLPIAIVVFIHYTSM